MVGVKPDRFTGRYCPKCENPMLYYGSIKHGMCMCLNNECRNVEKVEDALRLIDTREGRKLYQMGYGAGYGDAGMVGAENLSEVE